MKDAMRVEGNSAQDHLIIKKYKCSHACARCSTQYVLFFHAGCCQDSISSPHLHLSKRSATFQSTFLRKKYLNNCTKHAQKCGFACLSFSSCIHLTIKPTGQFLLNFTENDIMVKRLTCTYKMCVHVCTSEKGHAQEGRYT